MNVVDEKFHSTSMFKVSNGVGYQKQGQELMNYVYVAQEQVQANVLVCSS